MDDSTIDSTNAALTKVIGDSGTTRYAGYFGEEPNSKWRDQDRVDLVYEMRNTDSAVQAVLKAIKAPIVSASWSVQSYDDSPLGEEIRKHVEQNIFNLKRTFKALLRESLNYQDFGHSVFELIWTIKDGMIWLDDIAPRIQRSILNWQGTVDGKKVRGITQLIRTDEGKGTQVFIPEEKLFILTNDKEGDDVTGRSVLRSAYIHFRYKNVLYRVSGISADRYGVGIPTVTLPENYSQADKDAAEEGAANIRASEKGYMILPNGFGFEIKTPNGNPIGSSIDNLIAHHNRMIMLGTLTQFLDLGSDGGGSYALSGDQSSFFLRSCEEVASYWAEELGRQVIKKMVDLNYGPQEWYPYMKATSIGNKDLKQLAEILNILQMSGALDVDAEVKKYVREQFKLPELTDDQIEEEEQKDDADKPVEPEEIDPEEEAMREKVFLAEKPLRIGRVLSLQEKRVGFKLLNDQFNETETDLEDELSTMTIEELNRYAESVKKKLDAGDIAGIGAASFLIYGRVKKAIEKAIKKSYESGKFGAAKEMKIERPSTPTVDQNIMAMDIEDNARAYSYELEQRSRELIKDAVISGASTAAIVSALKTKVKDDASKMITNISGTIVGQYINRGRNSVFQRNLDKIVGFERSEVLDDVTCDMCLTLDQRVIKADDPMAAMDIVHSNCRGVWVPIFETDEEKPEITGLPKTVVDSFDTVDGRPRVNAFQQLKKPMNSNNKDVQEVIRRKMGV